MSRLARRARLQLTRLDDRVVPSTVNATTTARPFDFTGIGTLVTDDQVAGAEPTVESSTNTVTVNGVIDYTTETSGRSGFVTITGTGTEASSRCRRPIPPRAAPDRLPRPSSASSHSRTRAERSPRSTI
jgi:hypothetical protein